MAIQNENTAKSSAAKQQSISDPVVQQLLFNSAFESSEKPLDLIAMWNILWKKKITLLLTTIVFSILSVLVALSLPDIYRSEVLVVPATEESSSLGGLASKFGGLASLAGISIPNGGTDKTELTLEIMKSRYFVSKFIEQNDLLIPLMAVNGWDQYSNQLEYDTNIYDEQTNTWVRNVKAPFKPEPSLQEAYKEFLKIVSFSRSKDSSLIKISIDHYSPQIAKDWVEKFVQLANAEMKQRELDEARKNKIYLQEQLEHTNVDELKKILYQLLEEQEKTIMFANVREQYAFKTIDPALIPEERVKPNRVIIVLSITIFASFLTCLMLLIIHSRSQKQ